MAEPTAEDQRRAAEEGFFGHATGFVAGLAEYLQLRLQLAGLEAREAAIHYGIIAGLVGAALFVILFGYIFLCFAIVFGVAALIKGPYTWIWLTFAMALLHFGAAMAALLIAKFRIATPVFSATLNELKKDQEWLTSTTAKRI